MKTVDAISLALLFSAVGCVPPPEAPANPTWAEDVKPLLTGNCFHCHGGRDQKAGTEIKPGLTNRYDIYDLGVYEGQLGETGFLTTFPGTLGAAGLASPLAYDVKPTSPLRYLEAGRPERMPPPPADALSERDRTILESWARVVKTLDPPPLARGANRRPWATLVKTGALAPRVVGDGLQVTFDVFDPDGDQVLGKLTAEGGAETVWIPRTGRHENVIIPGAALGTKTKLTIVLSDGVGSADDKSPAADLK